jgi:hypothetical protein
MPKKTSKPGDIHLKIVEVLKRFPKGISGGQIRQELEKEGLRAEDQTHLDRRKRDLKKWFVIQKVNGIQEIEGKKRPVVLYRYAGKRTNVTDPGQVDIRIRAEVIRAAHSRCQMCGRTVQKHGVTLVVDHKKPRDWGIGFLRRRVSLYSSLIAVSGETTSSTPAIWFSAHASFSLASFTARVVTRLRWSLALRPGQGSFSCFGLAPSRFECPSLFVVLIVLPAPAAPLLSVLV